MDNGYKAITEDEGAIVEAGDQAKSRLMDWHNISAEDIGVSYHEYDFNHWEYRRPIAHYATPTEKVVEHLADKEAREPDWSKAPRWAEAWVIDRDGMVESKFHFSEGNEWVDENGLAWSKDADDIMVVLRPKTDEWVDGLPPVGADIVWLSEGGTWTFTKVIAYNEDRSSVWLEGEAIVSTDNKTRFEPKLIQSQIEERERKEFIEKAQDLFDWSNCPSPWVIKTIYDWLKSTDQLKDKR